MKKAEFNFIDLKDTLDFAVSVAKLGIWDWNIPGNFISYNKEYLKAFGYSKGEMNGTFDEWKTMIHPQDLPKVMQVLDCCLSGVHTTYECELRIKDQNGSYVWCRNVGKAVAYDEQGNTSRLIGVLLNIDVLKRSQEQLTKTKENLESSNTYLESQMESRTKELLEQDQMLLTVNQISRRLLFFQKSENFSYLVQDCLELIGKSLNKNRVYIWKDRIAEDGKIYCTLLYEWVHGTVPILGNENYTELSYDMLPIFLDAIGKDQCLNSLLRDLSDCEKKILEPLGVKTILIVPMVVNGKQWGFIGVDNCETEQLFTGIEENMLLMSGSLLCNTIEKIETEAALREMEERNQIMLNATPLCCNLWTQDFCNMSCNDEAVRLFELSSQTEYLERFNELSPEYQSNGKRSEEMAREYIETAFEEGYCRFEWLHQKLDGTPIPAEITLVRIKYKHQFIVAGYTRDLREQKAMLLELQSKEDDLRTARDEALLNSKAKSNFLANMSHEIRTPMNAISGLSEIILRESENEKNMEYARGIKNACENLINIINDILDISKIESGKLEIFNAPYELAALLNNVISISRARLGNKQLMFTANIDSHLPSQLIGDEIRIKQILINILSNAIKFTEEGFIDLRVSGVVRDGKASLRISVRDSGIGIKSEDLQRLFAEFERVNTTKNRSIEGTGLGLAISKHLCEMMGGKIEVESTYGKGSNFTVSIPQVCPSYERLVQVQEPKRVLLYEPRDRYRFSITETLENLECKCIPCSNQSQLYDNINFMPYDYILTASLHVKKVQSIVEKNNMSVQIIAFADYGERINNDNVCTILFPITCLHLAELLNGKQGDDRYIHRDDRGIYFVAPSATVLVVDDNPVNLQVAKGLMEPYQFTIETAENGLEAIQMIDHKKYDLVFMDHMMPEMDGIDATVAIRNRKGEYYDNLPIIALTANALVGTREMFIREGMNDFLAKPIDIHKLSQVLAKWLPESKVVMSFPKVESQKAEKKQRLDILGVNTEQGILAVGGSIDNYINILITYHQDGKQKCITLLQHISENDISGFRTEIHALKSTSATIGALEISKMAAKLEEAAKKNDVEYIDSNIDEFLTGFQSVLEAIWMILPKDQLVMGAEVINGQKTVGNTEELKKQLKELKEAAEFANLGQIEECLNNLHLFIWSEEVQKELVEIQKYLSVFDYDGIIESVIRLEE